MSSALNVHFVPALRQRGFKGSLPHLRRQRAQRIDLVTVQFDRHGGGFVVEISGCAIEGVTAHWGKHIPANKVTAHDLHPNLRHRLGMSGENADHWFRFDQGVSPTAIAESLCAYLDEAERWWAAAC
ncbi:DUF4304 domain-containing protein [Paraburkholderia sp. J11-2]|uniref:DUF4304 domain-containing protein n=1 Tax=Paraburkholderia sp. J11-2 TaxID=2805431 RepID=UPI002AB5FB53|nr:DUF4304 domain-containing protein [Paraburkholderia sp. J11-2]